MGSATRCPPPPICTEVAETDSGISLKSIKVNETTGFGNPKLGSAPQVKREAECKPGGEQKSLQ